MEQLNDKELADMDLIYFVCPEHKNAKYYGDTGGISIGHFLRQW